MRRWSIPLAVLLVYLMVPGAAELTEYAVHWVEHGDSAHGESAGHDPGSSDDEHGCSGPYHFCICHQGTGFVMTSVSPRPVVMPASEPLLVAWRHDAPHSFNFSDIFRPPIA